MESRFLTESISNERMLLEDGFLIWGYIIQNGRNLSNVFMKATYPNSRNVTVNLSYVTEDGEYISPQSTWIVKEGTTYEEMRKALTEVPLPQKFPKIVFLGWKILGEPTGVIEDSDSSMSAQYDKCVIRYIVDNRISDYEYTWDIPSDLDWDFEQTVLLDYGDSLQLPTQLGGYKDITWLNGFSGASEITTHITFYGYGVKDETNPEDTSKLPEELEAVIVQEIADAQPGQTVTVDMEDATVVSKEMLEAAKGKDVNIQLNLGGYSWTINGKDIMASDLSDINLEVKQDTGAIPNRVIQAMAGDNPVRQLSLTHNGNFGFRATLTINVGSENSGKYGNLYYYDSTGKLVFMNAGMIDANGNVTLSFSHASEYLLVVNDHVMSDADIPADLKGGTSISGGSNTTSVSTGTTSAGNTTATKTDVDVANTADATPTAWAGAFLLAALVLAGAGIYQKKRSV